MSRTYAHNPKKKWYKGKPHRPNNLGICMCYHCKMGRQGKRDALVLELKRKARRWYSNKPLKKKGAYTD